MRLPTVGYHVTYLDRLPSIKKTGLKIRMPTKMMTGFGARPDAVYLLTTPKLAQWAARDRNLDTRKDWVVLKVHDLDPRFVIADEDNGSTPEESIKNGRTFAYSKPIPPNQIAVHAKAIGTHADYHDEFSSISENTHHNNTRTAPSGVPAHAPGKYQQAYPILPIPFGIAGARGMPSTEFSVNASRLMQNVMGPDDIAQAKATHGNAPYDIERTYSYSSSPLTAMGGHAMGDVAWALESEPDDIDTDADDAHTLESFRRYVRLVVSEVHDRGPEGDEEETDEVSMVGSIAGYTAPLGTTPKVPGAKKKRQPAWSVAGRAFGNAKLV